LPGLIPQTRTQSRQQVLGMPRSHNRRETTQLAGAEASNLDLEVLARRKGCLLES